MNYNQNEIEKIIATIPGGSMIFRMKENHLEMIAVSEEVAESSGFSREELLRALVRNPFDIIYADDRSFFISKVMESIEQKKGLSCSARIVHQSGQAFWVHFRGEILGEIDGDLLFISTVQSIADIGNRMDMINLVPTGMGVYEVEGNEVTGAFLNDGYYRMIGKKREERKVYSGIRGLNAILPADRDAVREAIHQVLREGESRVTARLMIDGENHFIWIQLEARLAKKSAKSCTIYVSFSDVDALTRKSNALLMASRHHLEAIMQMNQDAAATFQFNLTKNTFGKGTSTKKEILKLQEKGTFTGFMDDALKSIPDESLRIEIAEKINVESLLKAFHEGQYQFSVEHPYENADGHIEWFRTSMNLMENHYNNEIIGIVYSQNIHLERIEKMILSKVMQKDYIRIIMYYMKQNEYYLFDHKENVYGKRVRDSWEKAFQDAIEYVSPEDRPKIEKCMKKEYIMDKLASCHEYTLSFRTIQKPDNRYQLQFSCADSIKKIVIITIRDITDEAIMEQLKYETEHYALTGLYNRDKTYRECDLLLKEHPDEQFAFVQFDIKKFRLYNTFYGEQEGDKLLQYFANMFLELSKQFPYGVYGHSHADVFLLCFPMSEGVFEKNQSYIHEKLQQYRDDFYLAGSTGVCIAKGTKDSAKELFNRASLAAKSNTKKDTTEITIYNDKIEEETKRVHQITCDMKKALEEHQFVVYLQPKYSMRTDRPYGAEALVRWKHPEKGLISPFFFIPVFESNGFISQLDRYMWEEVCILLRRWIDEGHDVGPISVNMSRVSMYNAQVVDFLSDLIEKYDIPADLLNLELTESAFVTDPVIMKQRIIELQKHGFKIMMDDFGSAYSSLNSLQELPFDYLKVDKQFLDSIEHNKRSRIVLTSVMQMASALAIPVITEGVETREQRDFVASIGTDYIQGYYYAKPMPVDEYEKTILD